MPFNECRFGAGTFYHAEIGALLPGPPDFPKIVGIAAGHGIEILLLPE
jgi:hypothetical protein